MARLVIFDESVRGVDLGSHSVILGRSRRADIPIHDRLLSRKHCAIVPTGSGAQSGSGAGPGFRVIDLKSSNGTYLNGARIDRHDLRFDDIIEIGNTVIVLLDTDACHRGAFGKGEGLPRLNNPAKARELIRAIRKREIQGKDAAAPESATGGKGGGPARGLRQKRTLTPGEREFLDWAWLELPTRPVLRQVLEAYVVHQIASLLVRRSRSATAPAGRPTEDSVPEGDASGRRAPDLGEVLTTVVERILQRQHFEGDLASLRAAVARALEEALSGGGGNEGDS